VRVVEGIWDNLNPKTLFLAYVLVDQLFRKEIDALESKRKKEKFRLGMRMDLYTLTNINSGPKHIKLGENRILASRVNGEIIHWSLAGPLLLLTKSLLIIIKTNDFSMSFGSHFPWEPQR